MAETTPLDLSSQQNTQNFIDPNMVPYYTGLAATAEALSKEEYPLYQGDRVAAFDPYQTKAFEGIASLTEPSEYTAAGGLYGQAGTYKANTLAGPGTLGPASFSAISGNVDKLGNAVFSPTFQNYKELGEATFSPTFQNYKELGGATFSPAFQNYKELGGATFSPAFKNYRELGAANFTDPNNLAFTADIAQQYINPYQIYVMNTAARKMQEEAARNIALGGLKYTGLGGYSGSANAINAASVNRALTTGIGDLYYKGLADAYANAQKQYESDRAARLGQEKTVEEARQNIYGTNLKAYQDAAAFRFSQEKAAEEARQNIYGTNLKAYQDAAAQRLAENKAREEARQNIYSTNLKAYQDAAAQRLAENKAREEAERNRYNANIKAQQDQLKLRLDEEAEAEKARQTIYGLNADKILEAFKVNEANRQWESENKRKIAEGLASLGSTKQTSSLSRLAALEQAGRTKQARDQRIKDIDYENFIAQRDWQRDLLSWASNIIQGLPAGKATSETTYSAPASGVNQLAGVAGALLSGSKIAGS